MNSIISRGTVSYCFIQSNALGGSIIATDENAVERLMEFSSVPRAMDFLRKLGADALARNELRKIALSCGKDNLSRSQNEEVYHCVARMLVDRRLRVVERLGHSRKTLSSGGNSEAVRTALEQSERRAQRPSSSDSRRPEPEPDTFPFTVLMDELAATLISAAKDGTPFCEQCERARRAAA